MWTVLGELDRVARRSSSKPRPMRSGSPRSGLGSAGSISRISCKPFSDMRSAISVATLSEDAGKVRSRRFQRQAPGLDLEMSRMSLMTLSRCCANPDLAEALVLVPGRRSRMRRGESPRIAFIGVRISWLMFARNALLAWLASSAARLASASAASARRRMTMRQRSSPISCSSRISEASWSLPLLPTPSACARPALPCDRYRHVSRQWRVLSQAGRCAPAAINAGKSLCITGCRSQGGIRPDAGGGERVEVAERQCVAVGVGAGRPQIKGARSPDLMYRGAGKYGAAGEPDGLFTPS